jgi:transcriptional antiterminator NusG
LLDKIVEEQTGTEMVLEEQKEIAETQDSTLGEQQSDSPELCTDDTEGQRYAPDVSAVDAEVHSDAPETESDQTSDNTTETAEQAEGLEAQIPEKPINPNAKWYILQAYSGYEGRVEQTINEKLKIEGLEHLVDEIFIPSEDVIRTKEGKKRKVNQKYFPGYVLINMELTPALWHLLMDVNRVSGFIGGTQKNPLPLDERELETIRSQVNERFQQKATEDEFSLGQKVTITEGSFGNFSGTIDEINLERRKLKVLVSIFGRPTPVEVEFEKVKHVVE